MSIVDFKPARCPHCGTAAPNFNLVMGPVVPTRRSPPQLQPFWAAWSCGTCGGVVLLKSKLADSAIAEMFPAASEAHGDIPEPSRTYLQQALDTLHAPDAAAVMAGSAVDAMLKHFGYEKGSLYSRIDEAKEAHLLTEAMAAWAHEVRLGSNRPRHADKELPHVSVNEAKQSVEFAEALGNFLFVLSARIKRGIEKAKAAK